MKPSDSPAASLPLTSPHGDAARAHVGDVATLTSRIPHRIALAGGWIDQPFVSSHNPAPPGSMVVVALEPDLWFMNRSGMASSTRQVATAIWNGKLPSRPREELVRELYAAENANKAEPSGSQDMIGLIYPGISRLDYRADFEGGYFPAHIESTCEPEIAQWLGNTLSLVPINQRPPGYNPLGIKNLDPRWIRELGESGKKCFGAIVNMDVQGLGASLNHCMKCWEAILPHTVAHPTIDLDLKAILAYFQSRYPGAMYSGCGGGYLMVASEQPVPGSFHVKVRTQ